MLSPTAPPVGVVTTVSLLDLFLLPNRKGSDSVMRTLTENAVTHIHNASLTRPWQFMENPGVL